MIVGIPLVVRPSRRRYKASDHVSRCPIPMGEALALPPGKMRQAWDFMFDWLVGRGFPPQDAEDVVQEVFIDILHNPSLHLDKLVHFDENKGWFLWLAMHR